MGRFRIGSLEFIILWISISLIVIAVVCPILCSNKSKIGHTDDKPQVVQQISNTEVVKK